MTKTQLNVLDSKESEMYVMSEEQKLQIEVAQFLSDNQQGAVAEAKRIKQIREEIKRLEDELYKLL